MLLECHVESPGVIMNIVKSQWLGCQFSPIKVKDTSMAGIIHVFAANVVYCININILFSFS